MVFIGRITSTVNCVNAKFHSRQNDFADMKVVFDNSGMRAIPQVPKPGVQPNAIKFLE